MAHVSLLLARTLDERVIAERAVAAAVPLLGDWAAIDVFSDGTVERLAIQHADPRKQELLREYAAAYPPRLNEPHLTVLAHQLNQSGLIASVTDEMLRAYAVPEDHIRWLHVLGARSAMAI